MSDGPSDCARSAECNADRFIKARFAKVKVVSHLNAVPKSGTVVFLYEEWLTHVVELITDGVVTKRWQVEPFDRPAKRLPVKGPTWRPGYYRDNRLPRSDA